MCADTLTSKQLFVIYGALSQNV